MPQAVSVFSFSFVFAETVSFFRYDERSAANLLLVSLSLTGLLPTSPLCGFSKLQIGGEIAFLTDEVETSAFFSEKY